MCVKHFATLSVVCSLLITACGGGSSTVDYSNMNTVKTHLIGEWKHLTEATQCTTSFFFSEFGTVSTGSLNSFGEIYYSVIETDNGLSLRFKHPFQYQIPSYGTNCFGEQGFDPLIDEQTLEFEIMKANQMRVTFVNGRVLEFEKFVFVPPQQ